MYSSDKKGKDDDFFFDEAALDSLLNQSNSKLSSIGGLQTMPETVSNMAYTTSSQELYEASIDDILMSTSKTIGNLHPDSNRSVKLKTAKPLNQNSLNSGIQEEEEYDYIDDLLSNSKNVSCKKLDFEKINLRSGKNTPLGLNQPEGHLQPQQHNQQFLLGGQSSSMMEIENMSNPSNQFGNIQTPFESKESQDIDEIDNILQQNRYLYEEKNGIATEDFQDEDELILIDKFLEKSENKITVQEIKNNKEATNNPFQENFANEKDSHSDSLLDDEEYLAQFLGDDRSIGWKEDDGDDPNREEMRREYICKHFGYREIFCLSCSQALCAVCRSLHDKSHEFKTQQFMSSQTDMEAKKLFPQYSKLQETLKKLHEMKLRAKFNEIVKIRRAKRAMLKFVNNYFKIVLNEYKAIFDLHDSDTKQLEALNKLKGEVTELQMLSSLKRLMKFEEIENFHFKNYSEELAKSTEKVAEISTELKERQKPKICFRPEYLSEIKENITHFLSLVLPQESPAYNKRVVIDQAFLDKEYLTQQQKMVVYSPESKEVYLFDQRLSQPSPPTIISFTHESTYIPFSSEIILAEERNKIYFVSNSNLNFNRVFIPMREIFFLDIEKQKMEIEACMKYERHKSGVCMAGDYIYILGGAISGARIRTNLCERYNIHTKVLEKIPKMTGIRLCPAVTIFKHGGTDFIYVLGGLKDQETVESSIEIFNTKELCWRREKVTNSYLYIPRHMHIAVQINQEEILLLGGLSERNKLNRRQNVQVYNVRHRIITDFGDLLPLGIYNDSRVSKPVINPLREILILNSLEAQIYPLSEGRSYDYAILKLGNNMRFRVSEIMSCR